ncbi:helix-turn-helix domain-containing protein, partial [Campylobacter coli]
MQITKGFKYRLYPNKEQSLKLSHQCFIYNQAYNICLNLQQEQWLKNKELDKKERTYLSATQIDNQVKLALKARNLEFK